jgi:hypothetical protein
MARLTEIHHQHRAGWIPPYSIARLIIAAGSAAGEGRGRVEERGREKRRGGGDWNGRGGRKRDGVGSRRREMGRENGKRGRDRKIN